MRYEIRSALITITAAMLLGRGAAQALSAPTITAPTSGSTVFPTPTLRWTAVTGASVYLVWLSQGNSGPNILPCAWAPGKNCRIHGVSLAVTAPLAPGVYTLSVTASNGSVTATSAATHFTVKRFEDRGFGLTVFDHQTGLEWEKKTDDGGIHDKDNGYT